MSIKDIPRDDIPGVVTFDAYTKAPVTVQALICRTVANMLEDCPSHPMGYTGFPVCDDHHVIAVVEHGIAKSFIAYYYSDVWDGYVISMAGTAYPDRHRGLYTKCWHTLVQIAYAHDVPYIHSGTDHANVGMQDLFEKQGREKETIAYRYTVPDLSGAKPSVNFDAHVKRIRILIDKAELYQDSGPDAYNTAADHLSRQLAEMYAPSHTVSLTPTVSKEPQEVYHARITLELDDTPASSGMHLTAEQRLGLLETIWQHYYKTFTGSKQ